MANEPGAVLNIVVAVDHGAHRVEELPLALPAGACLGDALAAARVSAEEAGIWGKTLPFDTPLAPGDRVEVYRPLRVDPKVARRERFKRQGARTTGLFKQRD
ncbi:RnfH family protein [Xylophilus rhododendri]|uniref:UPF0125 protein GT347_01600 n=1 Tax=Xylophilus rhododendri TaxID=2697032 RepID=A0A857J0U1_9BURK|nr:RnfH family protein [Xylophilus rhododendri]QHI96799.1 RnfH family protein [Xylophilus rhododendri]